MNLNQIAIQYRKKYYLCENITVIIKTSANMKIWKYSGIFLLATGALHTIVALLVGADEFTGMIRDGFINSVNNNAARGLAFWFFVVGIVAVFFGHVLHYYIKKEQKPAPLFLGYYLLALSVAGCLIIPLSGFWLFIPQAFVIIFANRKKIILVQKNYSNFNYTEFGIIENAASLNRFILNPSNSRGLKPNQIAIRQMTVLQEVENRKLLR
jgi:hypothetical protein